ncbi:MAG: hypothetical protein WDW36_006172 [Sanguina aurantia]
MRQPQPAALTPSEQQPAMGPAYHDNNNKNNNIQPATSISSLLRPASPGSNAAEVAAFQTQNLILLPPSSIAAPDSSVVAGAELLRYNSDNSINTTPPPLQQSASNGNGHSRIYTSAQPSMGAARGASGSGAMAAAAADYATTRRIQRCTNWYELRALLSVIGPLALNHVHVAALLSTLVRSITYTIGATERVEFDAFVTQALAGARNALPRMSPVELSITMYSLGKLGVSLRSSPRLLLVLLALAHPQLSDFSCKELAWLVWGLGRTCSSQTSGDVWVPSGAEDAESDGRSSAQAVKLPAAFLRTLSQVLVAQLRVMGPQDLANVAVGLTLLLPPASAAHPRQPSAPAHAALASSDDDAHTTAYAPSSGAGGSSSMDDSIPLDGGDVDAGGSSRGSSSSSSTTSSGSSERLNGAADIRLAGSTSSNGSASHQCNSSTQTDHPDTTDLRPFQLSFWRSFASASEQSLSRCTPQALSNIIHALAHAAYPDSGPWVRHFQAVTRQQLPSFNAQSLATMLGAMDRLGVAPHPHWWQEYLASASNPSLLQAATAKDLAQLSMVVASSALHAQTVQHDRPSTLAMSHSSRQQNLNTDAGILDVSGRGPDGSSRSDSSKSQQSSVMSSGSRDHSSSSSDSSVVATPASDYASVLPPFLEALDQCLENRAHTLPPSTLSTYLASMARLSHCPPRALHAWLASASKQLPLFASSHVAHSVWAFATLRLAPPGKWMAAAVASSKANLCTANARELALTIWSFHRLGYRPSWQWLLAWGERTGPLLGSMPPRDLGMVLHAASVLKWRPPAAWLAAASTAATVAVGSQAPGSRPSPGALSGTGLARRDAWLVGLQMSCILGGLHRLRAPTPAAPQLHAICSSVSQQLPSCSLRHAASVASVLVAWLQPSKALRPVVRRYPRSSRSGSWDWDSNIRSSSSSRSGSSWGDESLSSSSKSSSGGSSADGDAARTPQRTHSTHVRRHRRRIRLQLPFSLKRGSGPNSDAGSGFPAAPQHKLHPLASLLQPTRRPGSTQTPLVGLTGTRSRSPPTPAPTPVPPRTGLFSQGGAARKQPLSEASTQQQERGTMSVLRAGLRDARRQKQQLGRDLLGKLILSTLPRMQAIDHSPDVQPAHQHDLSSSSSSSQDHGGHGGKDMPRAGGTPAHDKDANGPAGFSGSQAAVDAHADQRLSSGDALSLVRLLGSVQTLCSLRPRAVTAATRTLQRLTSGSLTYHAPSMQPASERQRQWLSVLYSVMGPEVRRACTVVPPASPPSDWVTALLASALNACEVAGDSSGHAHSSEDTHGSSSSGSSSGSSRSLFGSRDAGTASGEYGTPAEEEGDRFRASEQRGSRLAAADQVALLYSVALVVAQQPPDQRTRQHRDTGGRLALKLLHTLMNTSTVPPTGRAARVHTAAMSRRAGLARSAARATHPHPTAHRSARQGMGVNPAAAGTGPVTDASRGGGGDGGHEHGTQQRRQQRRQQHAQQVGEIRSPAGLEGLRGAELTPTLVGHLAIGVALLLGPSGLALVAISETHAEAYSWLLRRLALAAPRMLPRQRRLLPAELMQGIKERSHTPKGQHQ